jgi:parvulin-like peptidyl-prolyl isomerase
MLPRILMIGLAFSGWRGCAPSATGDPVILSLGDQQIHRSEFETHLADLARRGGDPSLREAFLGPFLEERVLVLEARAQGLVQSGASVEDEKAAVETLVHRALPAAQVSEDEIGRYYREHAEEFRRKETVTLKQILVPTENEARDLRRRLQRDPKGFEILARTRSRSPEASTGGLMGTFEPGQLPAELEAPAFALAAGGTSDIVRSPLGFHVLRVEARQPAREEPLDEARPRIQAKLLQEKTGQAFRAYVQQLLSRAKVNHEVALSAPPRP